MAVSKQDSMDDFDDLIDGITDIPREQDNKANEALAEAQAEILKLEQEKYNLNKKLEIAFSSNSTSDGRPMLVSIEDVIENPDKPNTRTKANPEFEEWLTNNIKEQKESGGDGIQDPISVQWSEQYQKWIINKGHTRHKCGKRAGLTEIPVIIQDNSTDWNQVIENLLRDGLATVDVVKFIADKKAQGIKQKEIAKRLSQSAGWVSKHAALIDPPAYVKSVWDNGYAEDYTVLYALTTAHKQSPVAVEKAVNAIVIDKGKLSEDDIKRISEKLKDSEPKTPEKELNNELRNSKTEQPEQDKPAKKIVRVECKYDNETVFLVIRPASTQGNIVVERLTGEEIEVKPSDVTIITIVDFLP